MTTTAMTASERPAEEIAAFGTLLRQHRVAAGLSQEALAEAAGLSPRAVRALEGGERLAPHRDTVHLLAGALHLSASDQERLDATITRRRVCRGQAAAPPTARPGGAITPAAGSAGTPGALPVPLTSFVGRKREVAAIQARLRRADVRLLTLTGPGGVGKTRLAVQAATELRDDFADGVAFVDLAPIADPSLVPATVAQALGVREMVGRPLAETLQAHLRDQRLLLLLDNCEHLLDACARLVDALLRACPTLTLLATSREALGIAGETTWRVPSLGEPDAQDAQRPLPVERLTQYSAVRLFFDRAVAVQPAFQVTNRNALAVAQICDQLDGIPLAIEL